MSPTTAAPHVAPPLHHTLPAVVVHTALRRELRLAGPLVRTVAAGDTRRATVVADHLAVVLRLLHHHHETEDDLLWPPLRERSGGTLDALIDVMEDQHAAIERALERIRTLVPSWAATADPATASALAEVLDALHAGLDEHLSIEEREVFPVAEQLMTEAEWDEIGRRGEEGAAGRERTLVLGMLQHEGDPAVIATMLAAAPLPVRKLVPWAARRAYRRHALAVHGTATP